MTNPTFLCGVVALSLPRAGLPVSAQSSGPTQGFVSREVLIFLTLRWVSPSPREMLLDLQTPLFCPQGFDRRPSSAPTQEDLKGKQTL